MITAVDRKYFDIIRASDQDVTLRSKNTGHWWLIRCSDERCVIFHKYKKTDQFHFQLIAPSFRQAVRNIQRHDIWIMEGRNV